MDVFHRLLGTTDINLREFGWALVPAIALLAGWELGKLIARREAGQGKSTKKGTQSWQI
jgi:P-type Ca2+ transporter type 2C